jgi:hypothetical protein
MHNTHFDTTVLSSGNISIIILLTCLKMIRLYCDVHYAFAVTIIFTIAVSCTADSVAKVVTTLWTRLSEVWIPSGAWGVLFCKASQPNLLSMGNRGSFPRNKAARGTFIAHLHLVLRLRLTAAVQLHLNYPCMPSWRVQGQLYLFMSEVNIQHGYKIFCDKNCHIYNKLVY